VGAWAAKSKKPKKNSEQKENEKSPPSFPTTPARMAPPVTRAQANWAVELATGLPEFWANVAKHRGIVGTCQLMRVCRASHAGGMEHLEREKNGE
jgi:hypothetical protein